VRRVRLVEVHVQPVFVIDDGENLSPTTHDVVVIPANEWPTYSNERFPREVKQWEERLNNEPENTDSNAEQRE
jgi:hypothetical protein